MKNKPTLGHLAALLTISIWGITFVSTKILLQDFSPIEILFFRFVLGFIALLVIYPYRFKVANRKHELLFMCAGICGVTLYYLLENIALTFTNASNVGVISAVVPFFTAILTFLFLKNEPLRINFFIGFVLAMTGISLITYNGATQFQLNPLGDFLAVVATFIWAVYSVLSKKISSFGYHTIQSTRRIFFYGILFITPTLMVSDFKLGWERFANPVNLFHLCFLGLGASALCFLTWNYAVKILGAIKTSVYIYLVPVIAVIAAMIVLDEPITWLAAFGMFLTLAGLLMSESKFNFKVTDRITSVQSGAKRSQQDA